MEDIRDKKLLIGKKELTIGRARRTSTVYRTLKSGRPSLLFIYKNVINVIEKPKTYFGLEILKLI